MAENAVCSCSGGIDSTTTMLYTMREGYDVEVIHFNYGQLSAKAELKSIQEICRIIDVPLNVVDCEWLGKVGGSPLTDPKVILPEGFESVFGLGCWVPGRNVVFLAYASALCERKGGGVVTLGGESSESHYLDNTQEFADRYTKMLELGCMTAPVKVIMPLVGWTKIQELQWGYGNGFSEVYKHTWSCDQGLINGEDFIRCGRCGCCNSRRYAYYKMGMDDPQEYLDDDYFKKVFLPEYEKRKSEIGIKYE